MGLRAATGGTWFEGKGDWLGSLLAAGPGQDLPDGWFRHGCLWISVVTLVLGREMANPCFLLRFAPLATRLPALLLATVLVGPSLA